MLLQNFWKTFSKNFLLQIFRKNLLICHLVVLAMEEAPFFFPSLSPEWRCHKISSDCLYCSKTYKLLYAAKENVRVVMGLHTVT